MPKFEVEHTRMVLQTATREVEAENEDDAVEAFFEMDDVLRGYETLDTHSSDYTVFRVDS